MPSWSGRLRVSEQDRAPGPLVRRGRSRSAARVCEVVFEIGELDNPSQGAVWTGCVGDAFDIGAVVVVFTARQEHKRTELDRARSLGAQLADGQVRTLEDVVQPGSDPRVLRHRGCHALDVIE